MKWNFFEVRPEKKKVEGEERNTERKASTNSGCKKVFRIVNKEKKKEPL